MMKTAASPEIPMWQIRMLNEATAKVQDLSVELEVVSQAMRVFRSEHMAVLGTQLVFRCGSIIGRQEQQLDRQWFELVKKRDSLLVQWNAALKEFAEAKSRFAGGN
jgi:hypothetical protein